MKELEEIHQQRFGDETKLEPDIDPRDLEGMYQKDKETLDELVHEYRYLIKSIDGLNLNRDLKKEMVKEKSKFETTFVKIRCDVLTSRAQIEESLDELNFKQSLLKKRDEELKETDKLIDHYKKQIEMMNSMM